MTNPTDNPTPAPVKEDALPALRITAGRLFYAGRELKNYGTTVERICRDAACAYANSETRSAERAELPALVARMIANAEEVAAALPELRALTKGDAPAPVPKITDGGLAIVVQYRCPTDTRGGRWTARFDRDAETVFRATAGFTFDDKDNEGADNAAAACLAKFEAYCNKPLSDGEKLPPARFALVARASLGRGAYAYTFRRI